MLFPTWCLHICNYLGKDNSYRQSDCRSEKPLKYFFQRGVYIYAIISERIITTDNLIADLKSPWNLFPTWCLHIWSRERIIATDNLIADLKMLFPTWCLHICNYLVKDNSYRQSDCRLKSPWNTFYVVFTYMQLSRKG